MRKTFTLLFIFLITLQVAVKAQDRIYWGIYRSNISSAKLDGTDVKPSVTVSDAIYDMETDFYKGILYWGDGHFVKKANTDGTNLQTLYPGSKTIGGLALDLINNKLYFSEYGGGNVIIRRCNLDGTGMEVIVTSPNSGMETYNLAISTTLQKLYWTESESSNTNSIIMRCNLDGTNIETLMTTTSFTPGLTIDEKNQRLYLAYWADNKVMTTDMTCSTTPTLVFGSSNGTFQMAVSNVDDKLYFGEMETQKIRKCNLDGSSPQDIVDNLSAQPMALSIPTVPPAPTINANETYTFELNDFLFASVDKNLLTKIKITTLTGKGTLYLDANSNNIIDAGEAVVLNQEIAKADLVAGTLKFNPAANDYGSPYTTFTFRWFNGTSYSTLDLLQYIYVLSIVPTVTTQAVSDIGLTTATGNGNVTNLGVPSPTSYGICWNTAGSPTTSNSKVDLGAKSATGAFTAAITGLTANTTYKVRAYATNEAGTSYGTEVSFTTATPPTVTGISPTSGSTAGGTSVVITGTNFTGLSGAAAVKFGATNATSYTVNSVTQISATSPAGTGTVDITVTTAGGTSATSSADQFTYVAAPTVSGISPTNGSTAGGTSVVITGTNFTGLSGAAAVKFGATNATSYTVNSVTQITAVSPARSAGPVDITVTTVGGTSATSANDLFAYVAAPSAASVAASSISGTAATLNGTINAKNASTTVTFEYGLNTGYGTTVTATQSPVAGTTATAVSCAISGLTAGVTYHYRVVGVNAGGRTNGLDKSFTTPLLTGNGTSADPYQIATLTDLKWVSEHSDIWNGSFIQTADIIASETSGWNSGKGFSPIGDVTTKFTGSYNGQYHTITGLTINRPGGNDYNIGLFGVTTNATLKNIALLDCSIIGGHNVGSLVGCMGYNSTLPSSISDCYCTGNVSGIVLAGGLVGLSYISSITNSYSTCKVTATANAAGLVNFADINNNTTITNCFYDSNTSEQSDTGKGTPKTTAEMKMQSTFTGWDFTGETANGTANIWAISSTQNNGYPCFMSQITSPTAPTVTTQAVDGIATTTATGHGNITGLGVPSPGSHGVCWGTNANPTITDSSVVNEGGTSTTGAFIAPITGLTPNTLYHVRAYATNSTGPVYGTDVSFTTKIPTITSATYNASTGVLVLTCLDINSGDIISPAKLALTGEGGTPYSLTTANVVASSSTSASITLNATDKAAINQILNKNGTSSADATTYNLAAADDWDTSISAGDISDLTGNGVTVSNVAVPNISNVTSPSSGTYASGQNLDFTATFTKAVNVVTTGGTPYISLTIGGVTKHAVYVSGSGTTALVFRYTLASGDAGAIATGTGITMNGGTIKDDAGNSATLTFTAPTTSGITVDAVIPTITSVSSASSNGTYKLGDTLPIIVSFSKDVTVTGMPTLTLNSGGTAAYTSGTGTSTLTFSYTVGSGQSITDLDYSAIGSLALSGGTIKDAAGNNAALTLPTVGGANSLSGQKDILIGIVPVVTTLAVPNITSTTATGNGNIGNLGFPNPTQYGMVWSTSTNPTTALDTKTTQGTIGLTGSFPSAITGLTPNTLYHVRAYATNSAGTVYGDELSFTTLLPSISSATYDAGLLTLTCQNINSGDIINPAKFTLTGEGGATYTLTTDNVTASSSTLISITLNATDKAAINAIFTKNGTASTGGTTYNLAAADDWDATITAGDISDLTGNGITVSNACNNPTAGGTIADSQSGCNPFDPTELTSTALPSGYTGTIEYKWQSMTTNSIGGFTDIPNSNSSTYNPGSLTQTTWFKRLARVGCNSDWTGAAESNTITITVYEIPPYPTSGSNTYTYDGTAKTATAITANAEPMVWYTTASETNPSPALSATKAGIYSAFAVAINTTTGCSSYRREITLTINKKPLTVTAAGPAKSYGNALSAGTSTNFTADETGVGSEKVTSVTLTPDAAGSSAKTAAGSSYQITPSLATGIGGFLESNYEINYKPVSLTVGKAALNISANNKAKCYDGKAFNGNYSVTYQGFANEENQNVLDGTLSFDGTAINAINPGSYSIIPKGLSSNNYAITYQNGNLTINALPEPTISGQAEVSVGSLTSYITDYSMSAYLWTISDGGTISSGADKQNATISWNSIGSHTITANCTNAFGCSGASSKIVTVYLQPTATISGDTVICAGSGSPVKIKLTGKAPWNLSYTDGTTIQKVTNIKETPYIVQVSPSAGTTKTYTLVNATDANGYTALGSGKASITVKAITSPGSIAADQKIAPGSKPAPIISVAAGSGDGTISYTWEASVDKGLNWSAITNQNGSGYAPGVENSESWYRRITISTDQSVVCSATSTPVKITTWATGINETTQEALSAYAVRNIEIKVKGQVSAKAIAFLYDIQGKLLITKNMEEGCLNTIETSNIKPGVYMLLVKDADKSQSFKLMMKE